MLFMLQIHRELMQHMEGENGRILYWDFCNVILYDNRMKQQYPFNQTYVSRNAAHEIGHSVKLDHESASGDTSVMRRGWYAIPGGSGNITITSFDKNNAYNKWKNY